MFTLYQYKLFRTKTQHGKHLKISKHFFSIYKLTVWLEVPGHSKYHQIHICSCSVAFDCEEHYLKTQDLPQIHFSKIKVQNREYIQQLLLHCINGRSLATLRFDRRAPSTILSMSMQGRSLGISSGGGGGARFSPTIQNFRLAAIFPRNFTKFGKFWGATAPPPAPRRLRPCNIIQTNIIAICTL